MQYDLFHLLKNRQIIERKLQKWFTMTRLPHLTWFTWSLWIKFNCNGSSFVWKISFFKRNRFKSISISSIDYLYEKCNSSHIRTSKKIIFRVRQSLSYAIRPFIHFVHYKKIYWVNESEITYRKDCKNWIHFEPEFSSEKFRYTKTEF